MEQRRAEVRGSRTEYGTHSDLSPASGNESSVLRWTIWFRAIRFRSFTTSTVPIVLASALALLEGSFDPLRFGVMLLASMLTHAGCNLANDYFDHRRGVDTMDSLGPSGVIQSGWLTPRQVRTGIVVSFTLATLLGLWVAAVAGPGIFWLALASLGAAFLYTGGPAPLAYLALGELTVFLFMGVGMIAGAYYVHTGAVTGPALLLGGAIGLLAAAILHANNVRDIETDRARGKRTLANLLPRSAAAIEYAVLLAGAYVTVVLTFAVQPGLWPSLLVVLTIPLAWQLTEMIRRERSAAALNRVLRKTAGLHLRFGLLATFGVLLAAALERWG